MGKPKTVTLPHESKQMLTNQEDNDQAAPRPSDCCREVREAAYFKWEAAGCPCNDGVEFWLQAEAELFNEQPEVSEPKEE